MSSATGRVEFIPRDYQILALQFLRSKQRANFFADMGLGKTAVVLSLIRQLQLDNVLIVAPLRVANDVWPAEMHKWRDFADLSVHAITGPGAERERQLLALPRVAAINYEQLPWLVSHFQSDWPFTTVVCDESTRLKGFRLRRGTKRSAAMALVAHSKVERWINMTGTPNPNGLQDLWGQQWFVDGGKALGRSYSAFLQRWFYTEVGKRGVHRAAIPFPSARAEIEGRMQETTLALRTSDWFDIAAPIEHDMWIELPEEARRQYRSMERDFYAQVAKGTVIASNCAVKAGKLVQMASGAVYVSKGVWSRVHEAKLEALASIVAETGGANLLVVYQFISELERIRNAFPQAVDIHEKDAIAKWNDGKIQMLLCHPKSAGHGLNLQYGGHHIVYFSPTWDLELYAQVLERIGPVRQRSAGFDRPVFVHHILARRTIDSMVKKRRETKSAMMDLLMENMRNNEISM